MILVLASGPAHRAFALPQDRACFGCHAARGLEIRLGRVTDDETMRLKGPAHAQVLCLQCHPQAASRPHPSGMKPVTCASCHNVAPGHIASGTNLASLGGRKLPSCTDCHGHHEMRAASDPQAPVARAHIVQTCSKCHADSPGRAGDGQGPARQYANSVHGKLWAAGDKRAPVCTDCHGAHPSEGPDSATSPVYYQHVAATCGKCHKDVYSKYAISIHAQAVAKGSKDAPTCISCHGEHNIQSHLQPGSATFVTDVAQLCSRCHEDQRIVKLYGLPDRRLSTYMRSYHGAANRYGDVAVANCTSCHKFHDILPRSDPRSSIAPANLAVTCGKCHPGASENFARGSVHLRPSPHVDVAVFAIQVIYWLLIAATLGQFLAYMVLDLFAYRRERRLKRTEEMEMMLQQMPVPPKHRLLRMSGNERIQHLVLAISFALLTLTGTALLIPETSYARVIIWLCGGPVGRSIVHRIAAGGLIGLTLYHIYYIIFVPRGRESFIRGLPTRKDVFDAIQTAKYLIGLAEHRPCFGRYTFIEKFEYGAVIWGSFIMTMTGFVMWFENISLRLLPKWIWDMARAIHGYEAILAFSTIIIWHLYHTLWKPGVYPGNRSWLWGYISVDEFVHEHPLEYAEAVGLLPPETQRLLGGYAERLISHEETSPEAETGEGDRPPPVE